jgi:hypothetical protein
MKLLAKIPILHKGKQYSVGEVLPTEDELMVQLWLEEKSAEEIKEEEEETEVEKSDGEEEALEETKEKEEAVEVPKAESVTAQAGMTGTVVNSESEENMTGRVPKTASRAKGKK